MYTNKAAAKTETFGVGNKTFLLNGKPFIIKAAEVHYPRICWGKYVPADGRETLGMSVEVNHRFIDGYHLGQFYQKLQRAINTL